MKEADRLAETNWSKAELQIAEKLRNDEQQRQLNEQMNPTRKPLHKIFVLISVSVGVSSFLMALGQIVGIVFQTVGPVQYVLRVYVILLCILSILIELEWTKFARESTIFSIWITRGLYYAFIGVLGLEENDTSSSINTERAWYDLSRHYIKVVAWLMIGCGALYFSMGFVCLQLVYNRLRSDYQERLERAPEVRRTVASYRDVPGTNV